MWLDHQSEYILLMLCYVIPRNTKSVSFLCHLNIPLYLNIFARFSSLRNLSIGFIHVLLLLLIFITTV